jgi:HK97 gp10 family phage protein
MLVFDEIAAAMIEAAAASLTASALNVEALAKQKAPVRKIFSGSRRQMRFRSAGEVEGDRGLRRQLGLGPERLVPANLAASPPSRHKSYARSVTDVNQRYRSPSLRAIGAPGYLRSDVGEALLTRRGRYEVRSGRADTAAGDVGGTLRDEITATPARIEGSLIEATVISPTAYAKYQEFGTRHNPAHPFLRPALEESRTQIVESLSKAVSAAGRTAAKGVRGRTKPVRVVIR